SSRGCSCGEKDARACGAPHRSPWLYDFQPMAVVRRRSCGIDCNLDRTHAHALAHTLDVPQKNNIKHGVSQRNLMTCPARGEWQESTLPPDQPRSPKFVCRRTAEGAADVSGGPCRLWFHLRDQIFRVAPANRQEVSALTSHTGMPSRRSS